VSTRGKLKLRENGANLLCLYSTDYLLGGAHFILFNSYTFLTHYYYIRQFVLLDVLLEIIVYKYFFDDIWKLLDRLKKRKFDDC